jgi:hypothetical protein
VLGKLVISAKKIWPRRKEVEESEVYGGDNASFLRFVASQKKGEYYDDTFTLFAKYTSIRAVMSLVSSIGRSLH